MKKGNQWHSGYKEHIGVDAGSGLAHTVETTSANVHDSNMTSSLLQGTETEVYGDSGYLGSENKGDAVPENSRGEAVYYHISLRPSQWKKYSGETYETLRVITRKIFYPLQDGAYWPLCQQP